MESVYDFLLGFSVYIVSHSLPLPVHCPVSALSREVATRREASSSPAFLAAYRREEAVGLKWPNEVAHALAKGLDPRGGLHMPLVCVPCQAPHHRGRSNACSSQHRL